MNDPRPQATPCPRWSCCWQNPVAWWCASTASRPAAAPVPSARPTPPRTPKTAPVSGWPSGVRPSHAGPTLSRIPTSTGTLLCPTEFVCPPQFVSPIRLPIHPAISPATPEPPAAAEADGEPDDWSDELQAADRELERLGWDRDRSGLYLERAFGHPSRDRLVHYGDLVAWLQALRRLEPDADPLTAPCPCAGPSCWKTAMNVCAAWVGGRRRAPAAGGRVRCQQPSAAQRR